MRPAHGGTPQLDDHVVASVLALSSIRPEAVVRGRRLLGSNTWCRANEVAAELVDCLVHRRLP
jgi:hypothetical protein